MCGNFDHAREKELYEAGTKETVQHLGWSSWRLKKRPGEVANRVKEIADAHAYGCSMHSGSRDRIRSKDMDETAVERTSEGCPQKLDIGIYGTSVEGFACTCTPDQMSRSYLQHAETPRYRSSRASGFPLCIEWRGVQHGLLCRPTPQRSPWSLPPPLKNCDLPSHKKIRVQSNKKIQILPPRFSLAACTNTERYIRGGTSSNDKNQLSFQIRVEPQGTNTTPTDYQASGVLLPGLCVPSAV